MALDFDDENTYTGKLYLCPEVHLQPSFVDKEDVVHCIAGKAIMKGDVDIHKVHYCKLC